MRPRRLQARHCRRRRRSPPTRRLPIFSSTLCLHELPLPADLLVKETQRRNTFLLYAAAPASVGTAAAPAAAAPPSQPQPQPQRKPTGKRAAGQQGSTQQLVVGYIVFTATGGQWGAGYHCGCERVGWWKRVPALLPVRAAIAASLRNAPLLFESLAVTGWMRTSPSLPTPPLSSVLDLQPDFQSSLPAGAGLNAHISKLAVAPEWRRRGIARRLVQARPAAARCWLLCAWQPGARAVLCLGAHVARGSEPRLTVPEPAAALLQEVVRTAQHERRVASLSLHVDADNSPALALYQGQGFASEALLEVTCVDGAFLRWRCGGVEARAVTGAVLREACRGGGCCAAGRCNFSPSALPAAIKCCHNQAGALLPCHCRTTTHAGGTRIRCAWSWTAASESQVSSQQSAQRAFFGPQPVLQTLSSSQHTHSSSSRVRSTSKQHVGRRR